MRRDTTRLLGPLLGLVIAGGIAWAQTPLEPNFTYQGRLLEGGSLATGIYDFQFKLFDAVSGGNQIGNAVAADNVGVIGGMVTIELDFGPTAFAGDARWLEIEVRPGLDTGPLTTLSPRQPITPAPYSMFAMNIPNGPIPSGAVLYFQLSSCPQGWSEVLGARGRYVVGKHPASAPGDSVGIRLTGLENRPVGKHTHAASDSGHRHGYEQAFPNSTSGGNSQAGYRHADTDIGFARIAIAPSGDVDGTNAPYIVLLLCKKD